MSKLYDLVSEAFFNAKENGYSLELMSDEAVAEDMISYDDDISDFSLEEVMKCVKQYREKNK